MRLTFDTRKERVPFLLRNVKYIPDMAENLISVSKMAWAGFRFDGNDAQIQFINQKTGKPVAIRDIMGMIYREGYIHMGRSALEEWNDSRCSARLRQFIYERQSVLTWRPAKCSALEADTLLGAKLVGLFYG